MHIISRKALHEFSRRYPDSKTALDTWFHIMSKNVFADFNSLRRTFPSADMVSKRIIFNIGGNKYRLIAAIHFNRQKVYVLYILTHDEYMRGRWKI